MDISLGGGMHSTVNWRRKREQSSWRPPPGGAHAALDRAPVQLLAVVKAAQVLVLAQ